MSQNKILFFIFIFFLFIKGLYAKPSQIVLKRRYINQYVLIMDWIVRADSWIVTHYNDTNLCRFAHSISELLVELARKMIPPDSLKPIHPHLLIIVENMERSLYYCAQGEKKKYLKFRRIVLEEQKIIDQLLIDLHINIPMIEE